MTVEGEATDVKKVAETRFPAKNYNYYTQGANFKNMNCILLKELSHEIQPN